MDAERGMHPNRLPGAAMADGCHTNDDGATSLPRPAL
jgi:hypothetical protein